MSDLYKSPDEADTTNIDYELAEILRGGQGRSDPSPWLYALIVIACALLFFLVMALVMTLH